ncbi:agmatine deiminase family protein [Streptomyces sp. NPDC048411]|uniref:agmatine deiminase family protein n=1 Tax=Streptomyces sp. NPDC048411 TaxID=3157206 RepID=UPI00345738E3
MDLPRMTRRGFGVAALTAAALPLLGRTAFAVPNEDPHHASAEWEPHAACMMAWPWSRQVGWGGLLADVQAEIAGIARAIARFEPVVMVAEPGQAVQARAQCGSTVTVTEYPVNDCWTRDTGPIFAVNTRKTHRIGLDFAFNGWGNKYPYDRTTSCPSACARTWVTPASPLTWPWRVEPSSPTGRAPSSPPRNVCSTPTGTPA